MIPAKNDLTCPVAATINLIGNKWKLFIIRDLLSGTKRFGELRKSIAPISQKVLTQNLREMEQDGLIQRQVFAEVPPKVEYTLNTLGTSLKPIILAMAAWGTKYQQQTTKTTK